MESILCAVCASYVCTCEGIRPLHVLSYLHNSRLGGATGGGRLVSCCHSAGDLDQTCPDKGHYRCVE